MLKGIIFDFDGVLVESVDLKARAFVELFSEYPEHAGEIVRFHHANGGMNRFRKFEYIYQTILRKPLAADEKQQLGERFSKIVFSQVLKAPFVKGAEAFLAQHAGKLQMFIVSATPHDELMAIVAARKMLQYFTAVLGAPTGKAENINSILVDFQLKPEELVFVGDAIADYEGALTTGVPFIGRITAENNPFSDLKDTVVIDDLSSLDQMLKNHV